MPYLSESPHAGEAEELDEFHKLVKALRDVLGPCSGIDSDDVDPNELQALMRGYTSRASDWEKYAWSDPSRCYTRNLVDQGNGKSNLLILVWNPLKESPIHDHANAHCVMKILRGRLTETLYAWPAATSDDGESSPPLVRNKTTYEENEVTYICDSIGLHKITNPSSTEPAVSLHLYTPPHAATYGFNLFDARTGKATHIQQAGVYSDRGKPVSRCGPVEF